MIPKIIHYCWFGGGKLPEIAKRCIASWHKYLPDYEIKEWNEDNFDVMAIPYIAEAYKAKKYAFVSDFARFKVLYDHGGVYFDTDVEVIRPLDDIIEAGSFMGVERNLRHDFIVSSGLGLAASPGMSLYRDVIAKYKDLHFIREDNSFNTTTTGCIVTSVLLAHGLKPTKDIVECDGIKIYPTEYFNPFNPETRELHITDNTRTIHHYTATWHTSWERFVFWTKCHFGVRMSQIISLLGHNPFYIIKRCFKYFKTGK